MATNAEKYALGPVPQMPGADYARVPVDQFRAAVAKVVAEAWDEPAEKIFAGVDLGKKGADFAVATPRFKKGKPDEWVQKVLDAVSLYERARSASEAAILGSRRDCYRRSAIASSSYRIELVR